MSEDTATALTPTMSGMVYTTLREDILRGALIAGRQTSYRYAVPAL